MIKTRYLLAVFVGWAVIGLTSGAWAQASEYRVRDLLEPCVEGDNDSRGGAVLEMECEQYVSGFTDLYVQSGMAKADKVCLPKQNQADEIRWAFMRWAHQNFDKRNIPAVDGLIATLRKAFKCK
ncbi:MAG: Rap1a/Tai family immunity protein [Rhodospirillales bacterium]